MAILDWRAEHIDAPALDPVLHHAYCVKTSETTITHTVMNVATIDAVQMGEISSANAPSHQAPEGAERAQPILHHLVEDTVVMPTDHLQVVVVEVMIMWKQS